MTWILNSLATVLHTYYKYMYNVSCQWFVGKAKVALDRWEVVGSQFWVNVKVCNINVTCSSTPRENHTMQCNAIQYNTMGKTHMYVCMLIRQVEAGNEPRRDKVQTFLSWLSIIETCKITYIDDIILAVHGVSADWSSVWPEWCHRYTWQCTITVTGSTCQYGQPTQKSVCISYV